ncbi:E3 ubiquitin-protein ligase dtx3l [Physocladia obscura]|uniref:Poly [ADP-ribose] polymerase n=1 Tax=Physocladia obscura TaxID=109957 RepID=A0AAD5XI28_9FUNG|nr:E3 ubiquitin-protein ligase dtx3l [Physocladia obscura]
MNSPPVPPDYNDSMADAHAHPSLPYIRKCVSTQSAEFKVISRLLQESGVQQKIQIDRIANPTLYSQFCARRVELLKIKSRDEVTLQACGLSPEEISFRLGHASATIPEYSDNCALLFHCTKTNVDAVLREGLDNRKANMGSLGSGIYFSDNAAFSMQYDSFQTVLIFQVLLGDCLNIHANRTLRAATREPEKNATQKRSKYDLFFDSIAVPSQYVIFNSSQCFPLYAITYESKTPFSNQISSVPEFAWTNESLFLATVQAWKFDSRQIFAEISQECSTTAVVHTILSCEACQVCDFGPAEWIKLRCKHSFRLCLACRSEIQMSGKTLSGVSHTWVKCKWCGALDGCELGNAFNCGKMNSAILILKKVPGYGTSTIAINYVINGFKRRAYLPSNTEGRAILKMLAIAWDRRLTFKTGVNGQLEFNIEHKTCMTGNRELNGYPDVFYLSRVKSQMQNFGIF